MNIGEKIAAGRKMAGLTQHQLAQLLYVSRAAVAKWESGNGIPDIENIRALSKLFCVSMEDLLDDEKQISFFSFRQKLDLQGREPMAHLAQCYPEAYRIRQAVLLHGLNRPLGIINTLTFGLLAAWWRALHWEAHTGLYFWVDLGESQLLIAMQRDEMISTPLPCPIHHVDQFRVGGNTYLLTGAEFQDRAGDLQQD